MMVTRFSRVAAAAPPWLAALLSLFAAATSLRAAESGSAPFEYFVGHWDCAGHFAANGASIKSTIAFAWQESTQSSFGVYPRRQKNIATPSAIPTAALAGSPHRAGAAIACHGRVSTR